MAITLTISALTCVLMFLFALKKPYLSLKIGGQKRINVGTYWIISLSGAALLIILGEVSFSWAFRAITADSSINPLKILALFICMTALSVFLDETGFFGYLATKILQKTKGSQKKFFVRLYLLVSILTVFTSNDIVILTFTPFICYYAKNAKINPVPYLVAEFVAANSLSLTLIIGNPTNVYLATFFEVSFSRYFRVMFLPSIFAGVSGFFITYLVFNKQLSKEVETSGEVEKIKDLPMMVVGLIALISCTVMLAISSYIGAEMWGLTVIFALSLTTFALIYHLIKREKPTVVYKTFLRIPWELIPFVLSMFIIVLALDGKGMTQVLAKFLSCGSFSAVTFGAASFFVANLICNIPMSVLFCSITAYVNSAPLYALYASVIGSNIGAFLTPVGALAGIMWLNILKEKGVKFGFARFIKYGLIIALPVMATSIIGLYISLAIF